MWKYVFYVKYLREKGEDMFTGDEISIWRTFKSGHISWFPVENPLWKAQVTPLPPLFSRPKEEMPKTLMLLRKSKRTRKPLPR